MSQFKKKQEEADSEEWLTTYADSITLLLCFFVTLLSMSEPKMDKFEELAQAFASGFVQDMIEMPFETAFEEFQLIIEDNMVERSVSVEYTEDGLMLDLDSESLFASGTAALKPEAEALMDKVAETILFMDLPDYRVTVEGHTDDVPIDTPEYPSNWELSGDRATRIVRVLVEKGVEPRRLQGNAHADTRPKVPNMDEFEVPIPENRALNRRVVIRIDRVEK